MYKILHIPTANYVYDYNFYTGDACLQPILVYSIEEMREYIGQYSTYFKSRHGILLSSYKKLDFVIRPEHFELMEVEDV